MSASSSDFYGLPQSLPSFLLGVLALAVVELLWLGYVCRSALFKRELRSGSVSTVGIRTHAGSIRFNLEGNLWVAPLPEGDWSKAILNQVIKHDKNSTGGKVVQTREGVNDNLEIAPRWRHGILHEDILLLKAANGTEESIYLEGCDIVSVAGGTEAQTKWVQRFLIYLETGWEKEAWCELLRASAKLDYTANEYFVKTKKEYAEYALRVQALTPFLNKLYTGMDSNVSKDKSMNIPPELTKRQTLWKKLTRRESKSMGSSKEMKSPKAPKESASFKRKNVPSSSSSTDQGGMHTVAATGSDQLQKLAIPVSERGDKEASPLTSIVEQDSGEPTLHLERAIDHGSLCFNMIVSRLFFDFYHSPARMTWIHGVVQRLVSRIRTPSFIKAITVTTVDLGKSPPYTTSLRMLPVDAEGALGMEIGWEYHGNGFIVCETRVEVRDSNSQEQMVAQENELSLAVAETSGLLSGLGREDLDIDGEGLAVAEDTLQGGATSPRARKGVEGSTTKRGWKQSMKAMVSRVVEQVSQVPLALTVRCESLKGTGLIRMRAPPSNRIWFSFKEMPAVELVPEPCIGDHKISSGPLGTFIVNQLKVQLQESLVMPHCEDLCVRWMMAADDNWVPQSTIPVEFSPSQAPEFVPLNMQEKEEC